MRKSKRRLYGRFYMHKLWADDMYSNQSWLIGQIVSHRPYPGRLA